MIGQDQEEALVVHIETRDKKGVLLHENLKETLMIHHMHRPRKNI